jgi:hypothetical protein
MTRDHQRDLEAVGITVARYCNLCRRSIPIEDERNEERDWQTHIARHRKREARSG